MSGSNGITPMERLKIISEFGQERGQQIIDALDAQPAGKAVRAYGDGRRTETVADPTAYIPPPPRNDGPRTIVAEVHITTTSSPQHDRKLYSEIARALTGRFAGKVLVHDVSDPEKIGVYDGTEFPR